MSLQDAIKSNNVTRERLRAIVAKMNDADLVRDLGEGWTIAAVLAHLAFYDFRAIAMFSQWRRTGEVTASALDAEILNTALLPLALHVAPRAAAKLALEAAEAADASVAELELEPDLLVKIEAAGDVNLRLDRGYHRKDHVRQLEQALVTRQTTDRPPLVRTKTKAPKKV
jgi:hypothetical protein